MLNRTKNKKLKLIKSGSPKGMIALNCFDCSGHDQREVRACELMTCPLWIHRPRFKPTVEQRAEWQRQMIDFFVPEGKEDREDLDDLDEDVEQDEPEDKDI